MKKLIVILVVFLSVVSLQAKSQNQIIIDGITSKIKESLKKDSVILDIDSNIFCERLYSEDYIKRPDVSFGNVDSVVHLWFVAMCTVDHYFITLTPTRMTENDIENSMMYMTEPHLQFSINNIHDSDSLIIEGLYKQIYLNRKIELSKEDKVMKIHFNLRIIKDVKKELNMFILTFQAIPGNIDTSLLK